MVLPAIQETALINTKRAVHAKAIVKRFLIKLLNLDDADSISISASEEDLNSLMSFMARSITRLEGRINVTSQGLDAEMTFLVPHNPIGDFINVRAGIDPSESGLHLSHVAIGRIKIPDNAALFTLRNILDMVLGNENGTVALNSVRSVIFKQDTG